MPFAQPRSRDGEQVVPPAQLVLDSEKELRQLKISLARRKRGRATCAKCFSTRKSRRTISSLYFSSPGSGCATGETLFSSRKRLAPLAQPLLDTNNGMRRWRVPSFGRNSSRATAPSLVSGKRGVAPPAPLVPDPEKQPDARRAGQAAPKSGLATGKCRLSIRYRLMARPILPAPANTPPPPRSPCVLPFPPR